MTKRYSETLQSEITVDYKNRTVTTEDGVVYREHELRRLVGEDPVAIRAAHMIKRHFRGELIHGIPA